MKCEITFRNSLGGYTLVCEGYQTIIDLEGNITTIVYYEDGTNEKIKDSIYHIERV